MFQVTVNGDSLPELKEKLKAHLALLDGEEAETPKKPRKPTAAADDEEKPKKEKAVKLTEDLLREKLVATGWPRPHMAAFTKKFGYERIPEIPNNKYQEYVDLLEEVSEYSDKKREKYLEDELENNL